MRAAISLLAVACLAGCRNEALGQEEQRTQPVHVRPAVKIISISCDTLGVRPRAQIVVQNVAYAISFPRAFVSFGDKVYTGYFTPEDLQPDGLASVTVYGNPGDSEKCDLRAFQNSAGEQGNIIP